MNGKQPDPLWELMKTMPVFWIIMIVTFVSLLIQAIS